MTLSNIIWSILVILVLGFIVLLEYVAIDLRDKEKYENNKTRRRK